MCIRDRDLNVNLDSLQAEYDKLKATHTELAGQLAAAKEEATMKSTLKKKWGRIALCLRLYSFLRTYNTL